MRSPGPRAHRALALAALLGPVAACGGEAPPEARAPRQALVSTPEGSVGRIEVRQLEARPRLTLVSREGDPAPALVAAVATDANGLGSVAAVALASVVEARLRAAGFDVDARADRGGFRVRALLPGPGRIGAFLGTLSVAFAQPIAAGSPEIELARQRLQGLRQSPLDAPDLTPVAACTGRLGIAGSEPVPDLATAAGVRELEAWRRAALHAGRASLAAVGPAPFCAEASRALEATASWPRGDTPSDPWPQSDAVAAYPASQLDGRKARLTVAARVPSAVAAAAAAERLGAPDSPLRSRLAALRYPWQAVEVLGVARPRGGCVSITVEAPELSAAQPVETTAALAAALVRQEIRAELAGTAGPGVVARQILTAADPREAGARASWWALSSVAPDRPERWAVALGLPSGRDVPGRGSADAPKAARLEAEITRALAPAAQPAVERRVLVERGQGEVWVLLASPCGVAEEGVNDAGATALAALAAVQLRRQGREIALEPWVTAEGVGVIAHAPLGEDGEAPVDLARRVADAAARAIAGTTPDAGAVALARAAALGHLEQIAGPEAAALGAFAAAIAPDHPSWVQPFGLWDRVAGGAVEAARHRWQALAAGPLRAAILVNADAAQGAAAGATLDRWIAPRLGARGCAAPDLGPPRPGRYTVRLPQSTPLAQAMVGAPVPAEAGPAGRDLARLTAAALEGSEGLLAAALAAPSADPAAPRPAIAARATAQVMGGGRAAALIVDVRAPADQITDAAQRVQALLGGLAQRVTDADLARAEGILARREREARADPRRRLIDLWSDRAAAPAPGAAAPGGARQATGARMNLAAWRTWLKATLAESALVVVEARPE